MAVTARGVSVRTPSAPSAGPDRSPPAPQIDDVRAMHRVAAWLVGAVRSLRGLVRRIVRAVLTHISHCAAVVWLVGIGVFSAATGHRVLEARAAAAGAPPAPVAHPEEPQRVAMLDVDQINGIRDQRMHALGLAAAGEASAPDAKAIDAARAALAHGIEIDGEPVATAGGVVVVTRDGIAGWLARNRGKKADPETLAWLRADEAASGREAYAAWTDREDGDILRWAQARRAAARRGDPAESAASADDATAFAIVASPFAIGAAAAGAAGAIRDGSAAHAASGAIVASPFAAGAPGDGSAVGAIPGANAANEAGPAAHAAARSTRGVAIQGLELAAIGGAAVGALAPRRAMAAAANEIASLRVRIEAVIEAVTPPGAMKLTVRDHRAVVMLLCDALFERARPELTLEGAHGVRGLGRLLAADRDHAYRVVIDRGRALELVSNLVIAGLPAERIEVAFKDVDRAIDVAEIEWIDVGSP